MAIGRACLKRICEASPKLSIIVPTRNESPNLEPLLTAIEAALGMSGWEIIFVDDDSPDGTASVAKAMARHDRRIRCVRRIGRRGLASAVIEGVLSSSADYVAVIDGDLQHDERLLSAMLARLETDQYDVVVASRFVAGGHASGLDGIGRKAISQVGNMLARKVLGVKIADPLSGFFIARRSFFKENAARLSGHGFKVLLDLLSSAKEPVRVEEMPMKFRPRTCGVSKLDLSVQIAFGALLLEKTIRTSGLHAFPCLFSVRGTGVFVHLVVLRSMLAFGIAFPLCARSRRIHRDDIEFLAQQSDNLSR